MIWIIVLAIITGFVVGYVKKSLKRIEHDERAVLKRFGKLMRDRGVLSSGLYWQWWPFEKVILSPTLEQIYDLTQDENGQDGRITVVSKRRGRHKSAIVKFRVKLLFHWPTDKRLFEVVERIPNPYDEENVIRLIRSPVREMSREVTSRLTWRQIVDNPDQIIDKTVEERLKKINEESQGQDLENQHIIVRLHLVNVRIIITDVEPPNRLTDAVTEEEIAALEAAAMIKRAEGKKESDAKIGEGQAEAIRKKREALNTDKPTYVKTTTTPEGVDLQIFSVPDELSEILSGTKKSSRGIKKTIKGLVEKVMR